MAAGGDHVGVSSYSPHTFQALMSSGKETAGAELAGALLLDFLCLAGVVSLAAVTG